LGLQHGIIKKNLHLEFQNKSGFPKKKNSTLTPTFYCFKKKVLAENYCFVFYFFFVGPFSAEIWQNKKKQ